MRLPRFRIPDWSAPSPLGWIAWYLVSRFLELYVLSDFWRLACYLQALFAVVLLFPRAVGELKRHVIGERTPWESRLWNALSSRLPSVFGTRAVVPMFAVVSLLALSPAVAMLPSGFV